MTIIDPKSIAGILLREFDTPEQALRYAKRMAQSYADSRSMTAFEYLEAAQVIARYIKEQR